MLFKLIPLIQGHGKHICEGVMQQIQQSPHLGQIQKLPESYLRERLQGIITHLDRWLAPCRDEAVGKHHRHLGRLCFEQSVPLHEAVQMLHLLKNGITDFVRNQGITQTSMELYAAQELDHLLGRLFEALVYQVVCGYEEALLDAARQMPAVCRLPLPAALEPPAETGGRR